MKVPIIPASGTVTNIKNYTETLQEKKKIPRFLHVKALTVNN